MAQNLLFKQYNDILGILCRDFIVQYQYYLGHVGRHFVGRHFVGRHFVGHHVYFYENNFDNGYINNYDVM